MTHDEFTRNYYDFVERAKTFAEKARREGLLALEEMLDEKKVALRDVFEYGLRFVVDGTDQQYIEKILSNLVEQEKDEYTHLFKKIQKEAVLMIQAGDNPRLMYFTLNSYTDLTIEEDKAVLKEFDWWD